MPKIRKNKLSCSLSLSPHVISRTDEGQPRPKYIFNKCGTNIYFFTLQRFGPSPSPNFKKALKSNRFNYNELSFIKGEGPINIGSLETFVLWIMQKILSFSSEKKVFNYNYFFECLWSRIHNWKFQREERQWKSPAFFDDNAFPVPL